MRLRWLSTLLVPTLVVLLLPAGAAAAEPDDGPVPAPDPSTAALPDSSTDIVPDSPGDTAPDSPSASTPDESEPDRDVPLLQTPGDKPYWRRNLFKRVFSDQKFLFTDWIGQEAHRPGVTLPLLAGVVLAVGSQGDDLDQPDLEMERHFFATVDGEHTSTATAFTRLGDAGPAVLFLGASYLIGKFGGHDRLAEASSLSAEALLDTGIWTTILKRATARTRPSGDADGSFFQYQPAPGQSNASFPSGHASGAFALATVFSGLYGQDHRWVSWVSYGAAGLVGISRIGLGRHFTSDVIVGSVIGNSFGRMVLARRDGAQARRIRPAVGPTFDPETGATGAELTLRW